MALDPVTFDDNDDNKCTNVIPLNVQLRDLYYGTQKKIKVTLDGGNCPLCGGTGFKKYGTDDDGASCWGAYSGSGPARPPTITYPCKGCKEKGQIFYKKKLRFTIPSYTKNGDTLYYLYEFNYIPILIKLIKNVEYSVKLNDLYMVNPIQISLFNALCGGNFVINHFDNKFGVECQWNVIKSNKYYKIPMKGLSTRNNDNNQRGNLFVKFNILMPNASNLDQTDLEKICKLLPHQKNNNKNTKVIKIKLNKIDEWDKLGIDDDMDQNMNNNQQDQAPECKQM